MSKSEVSTLGCALQVLSTSSVSHRVSHWRLTLAKSANVTEQLALRNRLLLSPQTWERGCWKLSGVFVLSGQAHYMLSCLSSPGISL